MTRLPRMTGKEIIITLRSAGFEVIRIKGSHHFLQHPDGRVTVIPVHSGEIISPGLIAKILLDCDLSREEFQQLL
jgi:predicted RNA binding protein YcfA (HicA-like mRNA interferase family)